MYRCSVGFRTMELLDILSPAGGQPGTISVLEHWLPGILHGGDSGGMQRAAPGTWHSLQPELRAGLGMSNP